MFNLKCLESNDIEQRKLKYSNIQELKNSKVFLESKD